MYNILKLKNSADLWDKLETISYLKVDTLATILFTSRCKIETSVLKIYILHIILLYIYGLLVLFGTRNLLNILFYYKKFPFIFITKKNFTQRVRRKFLFQKAQIYYLCAFLFTFKIKLIFTMMSTRITLNTSTLFYLSYLSNL